ncbi:MAG: hypothetical protein AAFQ78_03675, partial [Bacteroidota bacterium]
YPEYPQWDLAPCSRPQAPLLSFLFRGSPSSDAILWLFRQLAVLCPLHVLYGLNTGFGTGHLITLQDTPYRSVAAFLELKASRILRGGQVDQHPIAGYRYCQKHS